MADCLIHILQAEHNEKAANKLAFSPPYHDWGITATFYSAIHYFESWIFYTIYRHTETSIPIDNEGKRKYSLHRWREEIAFDKLTRKDWDILRKLRITSGIARYLNLGTKNINWLNEPAFQHFKPQDTQKMVKKDLQILKKELKIDLVKLLHSLQLEKKISISIARLVISQILDKFQSKEEFLSASRMDLKQFLKEGTLSLVEKELETQGQVVNWK